MVEEALLEEWEVGLLEVEVLAVRVSIEAEGDSTGMLQ